MADVLTAEDMADLVIAVMRDLNRGKWIGEMVDLTDYVGFSDLVKKRHERKKGNRGITLRYVTDHNHSAQHVGLYNTIQYQRDDAIVEGTVPWVYTDANMVFDEREEAMHGGAEEVVDLIKIEMARALASTAVLSEDDVWGIPNSSSDDDTPFGIQYWITQNSSLGFNGGNPSGFTAGRAGISSGTYTRHQNFTGAYTSYDDTANTGLIYQMEQASKQMVWRAPHPEPGMGRKGFSKSIYLDFATFMNLKNVAKANNDSLGFDLSTTEPVFRGAPLTYVPYFDSNFSNNPVYMVDLNHFYAVFLRDWHLKITKVGRLPNQPHCFGILISMVWNVVCDDVRKQAVFYNAS